MMTLCIFLIPLCNIVLLILFFKSKKNDNELFKALDGVIQCLKADNKLLSAKLATVKETLDLHITQGRKLEASRTAQFAELEGRYLAEMRKKVDSEPTAM